MRRKRTLRFDVLEGREPLSGYGTMPSVVPTVESISTETTTQVSYPMISVAEYVEPGDFYA